MTNESKKIFDKLSHLVKMKSDSDIQEFEKIVWDLAAQKNPMTLDRLIHLFYEECPFREVMYSVVHAIETYPDDIYVIGILRNVKFLTNVPFWAKTILYGILNNSNCTKLFKSNMSIADSKALLLLLKMVYNESQDHKAIIEELRLELSKK